MIGLVDEVAGYSGRSYTFVADMEVLMPVYKYFCESCQREFELALTLHEHDESEVKCPKCGSANVHQMAAAFTAVTSRKS